MTASPPQRQRMVRRALHGVLLLDKPLGWTSHDALQTHVIAPLAARQAAARAETAARAAATRVEFFTLQTMRT